MKIYPQEKELVFPKEGVYDYLSRNGRGYFFPTGEILYVPIIYSVAPSKGFGTKLIEELEQLVLLTPELKEIAFPNIINPILIKMVLKRGYKYREEFDIRVEENVEIYYKELSQGKHDWKNHKQMK